MERSLGVLLLSTFMALAQSTSNSVPVPQDLMGPRTAWGNETNSFRAGLVWGGLSGKMDVSVLVLTFKTNTGFNYVAPPEKKFLKSELRDARGVLLTPLKGKNLDGELVHRILTADLPHSPPAGIHNPAMIENWLMLGAGLPGVLRSFLIEDAYKIEREGDYTLTVWASIYEFAPDRQSVSRIDLPPVTAKIHLAASIAPEGASPGITAAYVVGATLCVAGVVWLVAHWRRRNGGSAGLRSAKATAS